MQGHRKDGGLNKSPARKTRNRVRQKGATPAQLEQLYRDGFEHFASVASAICGDLDLGREAVQAAFMAANSRTPKLPRHRRNWMPGSGESSSGKPDGCAAQHIRELPRLQRRL